MFRFILFAILLSVVCAENPNDSSSQSSKQFRYVEEEPIDRQVVVNQQRDPIHPKESNHWVQSQPEEINSYHNNNGYDIDVKPDEEYPRRPIFTINKSGKNVGFGLNLGNLYEMDVQKGPKTSIGSQALNLGFNVLNGLIKVNVQREKSPFDSKKRGPVLVAVGGHTIYDTGR